MNVFHADVGIFRLDVNVGEVPESLDSATNEQINQLLCFVCVWYTQNRNERGVFFTETLKTVG